MSHVKFKQLSCYVKNISLVLIVYCILILRGIERIAMSNIRVKGPPKRRTVINSSASMGALTIKLDRVIS